MCPLFRGSTVSPVSLPVAPLGEVEESGGGPLLATAPGLIDAGALAVGALLFLSSCTHKTQQELCETLMKMVDVYTQARKEREFHQELNPGIVTFSLLPGLSTSTIFVISIYNTCIHRGVFVIIIF